MKSEPLSNKESLVPRQFSRTLNLEKHEAEEDERDIYLTNKSSVKSNKKDGPKSKSKRKSSFIENAEEAEKSIKSEEKEVSLEQVTRVVEAKEINVTEEQERRSSIKLNTTTDKSKSNSQAQAPVPKSNSNNLGKSPKKEMHVQEVVDEEESEDDYEEMLERRNKQLALKSVKNSFFNILNNSSPPLFVN